MKKADDAFQKISHLKDYLDGKHNQTIALNDINQKLKLQNYIFGMEVNEFRKNLQLKAVS